MSDKNINPLIDHHDEGDFDEAMKRERGRIEQMRDTAREEDIIFKKKHI